MELSTSESLWASLLVAVGLAAVHLGAGALRHLRSVPEPALASFAGGVAVAYVFLHLFPELAAGNRSIGAALHDVVESSALLDLGIFAVALAGFVTLLGLELLARRAGERAPGGGSAGLFWLHLGTFGVSNALITYTMPLRLRTGVGFAVLFTVAMGLHFVLTDRGMAADYPRRFSRYGRFVLSASLLVGWIAVAIAAPANTVLVSLLTALLAGFVLMNVFKEELPADRETRFGWFLVGLILYAALLGAVTVVAE